MRVFLTGATGFVGRNCLEWLLQNQPDSEIICLVRDLAKAHSQWPEKPEQVTFLSGDLLQPESYQAMLLDTYYVIHAAALVSLKNGPEFYPMNTEATRCLLKALKPSQQLRRLVFVSSISAVDRPLNLSAVGPLTEESPAQPNTDYGRSKWQAEELVRASGLPYSILRPAYIYGPHPRPGSSVDKLIRHIASGQPYTRFPFPGRASAIYAPELAEMLWIALTHPQAENETFFVSSPEPLLVREVFAEIADALEIAYQPLKLSERPMRRFQQVWYRQAANPLLLRILFEDFFYCSSAKWRRVTGYQSRYNPAESLRKTVALYRKPGLS